MNLQWKFFPFQSEQEASYLQINQHSYTFSQYPLEYEGIWELQLMNKSLNFEGIISSCKLSLVKGGVFRWTKDQRRQHGRRIVFNTTTQFDLKYKETRMALGLSSISNKQKTNVNKTQKPTENLLSDCLTVTEVHCGIRSDKTLPNNWLSIEITV